MKTRLRNHRTPLSLVRNALKTNLHKTRLLRFMSRILTTIKHVAAPFTSSLDVLEALRLTASAIFGVIALRFGFKKGRKMRVQLTRQEVFNGKIFIRRT
ncbi:hypothetical protein DPMN_056634 [Dreissena polymorpha]|uniref:Uncharacterized protein n=1 Tax=Dreissena polymorpha TaxID=45954 RepID=A0A9D4CUS5_DREPO|nr:hypothetical protein DPMN_056634 [Dreissena polymorpha]